MIPPKETVLAWARASKRPEILAVLQRLRDAKTSPESERALECLFLRFMVRDCEEPASPPVPS
jgi:hypothetical protein